MYKPSIKRDALKRAPLCQTLGIKNEKTHTHNQTGTLPFTSAGCGVLHREPLSLCAQRRVPVRVSEPAALAFSVTDLRNLACNYFYRRGRPLACSRQVPSVGANSCLSLRTARLRWSWALCSCANVRPHLHNELHHMGGSCGSCAPIDSGIALYLGPLPEPTSFHNWCLTLRASRRAAACGLRTRRSSNVRGFLWIHLLYFR